MSRNGAAQGYLSMSDEPAMDISAELLTSRPLRLRLMAELPV